MGPIESLEFRRLLAIGVQDRILQISTNNVAHDIVVEINQNNPTFLRISIDGQASNVRAARLKGITIAGNEHADRIAIGAGLSLPATILGYGGDDILFGVPNAKNVINGGYGNDSISGGARADTIYGEYGDDTLVGGRGNDKLFENFVGNDLLIGGAGSDNLYAGPGDDTLYGLAGNDSCDGQEGNDTISCGEGNDTAMGDMGDDSILGGIGNDSISGYYGNDFVSGEAGDDSVGGGEGDDRIYGGAGKDEFGALGTQTERKDFDGKQGDTIQIPKEIIEPPYQAGGLVIGASVPEQILTNSTSPSDLQMVELVMTG